MIQSVEKPRVVAVGLSLDFYARTFQGYMLRLEAQFQRFIAAAAPFAHFTSSSLCTRREQLEIALADAQQQNADAVLVIPLSYTASGMSFPPLLRCALPVVVWNTQEATTISDAFNDDNLLMNHVTQGTQDLTNALFRAGLRFGMESGHYQDRKALSRLGGWLAAARAQKFARKIRVGLLGQPFQDMGDFGVDSTAMTAVWGPEIVRLEIPEFIKLANEADPAEIRKAMSADRERFECSPELTEEIHARSSKLEWALLQLIEHYRLDAFTMNFMSLIADGRCGTLPFLGINKAIGRGLGYAGEGDCTTAAHAAQLRQLCGESVFTEIYTIDYVNNRLLMTHMQECNPALARRDRKVRLIRKDFWAPGVEPYAGMHFTLEPGPVTLTAITPDGEGKFVYIAAETKIHDMSPLKDFELPHWIVQLDGSAGEFLTRYSMAGGPHHLAAAPGHCAAALERLAHLQGFAFKKI